MNLQREQAVRQVLCQERKFPVRRLQYAFSLIELLVVVGIIGVLAGLAVHSLPSLRTGNQVNAANRQVLDAISEARARAISTRSTVYLVFVPPYFFYTNTISSAVSALPVQQYNQFSNQWNNLVAGQYTTYALYAERQVGDQPGGSLGRYLTEWRSLPKGTFIATNDFYSVMNWLPLPFPDETFPQTNNLRVIGFNSQGQLATGSDIYLHVAQGSLLFPLNADGSYSQTSDGEPREVPPGNSANNVIHVNWLTGRGRIEQPQIQ